ncbi:MAG: A24 family peptidase [Planctomycetota bacterium]
MTIDLVMIFFVGLLGLCVGSFLNVVVYRLPAGMSIGRPARSFCPKCSQSIAWYDNIPVLSWWLLGARCRHCQAPISVQYPLVEAVTGLSFVAVYYLLFILDARVAANQLEHPQDWLLLLTWLVLVAGLIACSAMDLVSYMVDVRITYTVMLVGLLGHMAWPRVGFYAERADTPIAAAAVAAGLVSVVVMWLTVWRESEDEESEPPESESPASGSESAQPSVAVGRVVIVVLGVLAVWLLIETGLHTHSARNGMGGLLPDNIEVYNAVGGIGGLAPEFVVPAVLLALFAITVLVGGQHREADVEVKIAIEDEQPQARKMIGHELLWLSPMLVAGVGMYFLLAYVPAVQGAWSTVMSWSPGGGFQPVAGLAYGALGLCVGAAAGWVLRIVFTLVFGREALGIGDIYILAAAGAAGGWDIALLGLILAVGVALAGYVISLLLKRTLIIPFGPWLAIGFIVALWLNKPAAGLVQEYYHGVIVAMDDRPDICFMAGGLMLVGSGVAVVLAQLVRRLVEPPTK